MSEARQRSQLVKALKPLDGLPTEVKGRAGFPDMNYVGGWIECKYLQYWPKYCDTRPVRFKHPWTKVQQLWAMRRIRCGGTVILCAKVGTKDWFFWECTPELRKLFGNATRPVMVQTASLHLGSGLNSERLIEWLKKISKG